MCKRQLRYIMIIQRVHTKKQSQLLLA